MTLFRKPRHPVRQTYDSQDVAVGQRALDVGIASIGLLVLAVPMLVIVLVIWLEGGRPLFFSQSRLGQYGRPFRLYKFRKFRLGESGNGAAVTVNNDCRLTRIGKVLARTKLDELPQLWNVLKGDMSIVGPRPEVEAFADCFEGRYRGILAFRPGIFGPNQVFFRDEASLYPSGRDPEEFYRTVLFPLKGRVDLAYFPQRSTGQDIAWIIRSVFAVLRLTAPHGSEARVVDEVENWIRERGQATPPPVRLYQDI